MKIFGFDTPFHKYGTYLFDILAVSLLWLLIVSVSFGLLMGPALAAAYAALYEGIVKDEKEAVSTFFRVFRKRFVTSMGFGLVTGAIVMLNAFNLYVVLTGILDVIWLLPVFYLMSLEVLFTMAYGYPLLATTKLKFKDVVKYGFLLANKHLPMSFLVTIVNAALIFVAWVGVATMNIGMMIVIYLGVGIVILINNYIITRRVLGQYEFPDINEEVN